MASTWRGWELKDLNFLRAGYPHLSNKVLAKSLRRTARAVLNQAIRLGLKKSPKRLARMGAQNRKKKPQVPPA